MLHLSKLERFKSSTEEKSDAQPIQYTNYDCHRMCEERHNDNIWRAMCKSGCNITNPDKESLCYYECTSSNGTFLGMGCYDNCMAQASQPYSQEPTLGNIKSTLENIGDSFYSLADSVSVL